MGEVFPAAPPLPWRSPAAALEQLAVLVATMPPGDSESESGCNGATMDAASEDATAPTRQRQPRDGPAGRGVLGVVPCAAFEDMHG